MQVITRASGYLSEYMEVYLSSESSHGNRGDILLRVLRFEGLFLWENTKDFIDRL